jgi:hypothetical protein
MAAVWRVSGVARVLAALPGAPDVRAGVQVHVGDAQPGDLRDPQPGLDRQRQQGVVSPAGPAGRVRGR